MWSESPVKLPNPKVRATGTESEFRLQEDDDLWFVVPFADFRIGSLPYSTAYVSSNGIITFNDPNDPWGVYGDTKSGYVSYEMRLPWEMGPMLAPYWMDHDSRGAPLSGVKGGLYDDGVERYLRVWWVDMPMYDAEETRPLDSRGCQFMCTAYESGLIEYTYETIQLDCGSASYNTDPVLDPTENTVYWNGPIVGYWFADQDWIHPASMYRTTYETGTYPPDPVYGADYLLQGLSGFTEGGASDLTTGTNCGIPGTLRFNL